MTHLACLIAALTALTALAIYLDHIGFDPFARYDTDPRDLVDRAHEWPDDDRDMTGVLARRLVDRADELLDGGES